MKGSIIPDQLAIRFKDRINTHLSNPKSVVYKNREKNPMIKLLSYAPYKNKKELLGES